MSAPETASPRPRRRLRRVLLAAGGTLLGLTVFVGILHTDLGRPLLRALASGACPLESAAAPAALERARLDAAYATAGATRAAARPALVFSFETTTAADVLAWAAANDVSCEAARADTFVRCSNVPAHLVDRGADTLSDLSFGFSPATGKLVNLTTLQSELSPAAAAQALEHRVAALEREVGPATRATGGVDAASLAPRLATASRIYRFSDYQAEVSGTSYPGRGVIVREHFMAVN